MRKADGLTLTWLIPHEHSHLSELPRLCILVLVPLLSSCIQPQIAPPKETESILQETEISDIQNPALPPIYDEDQIMTKKQLSDVAFYLPKLQETTKVPAWVGFILQEGCKCYFQFEFHDDEFWLQYMLFPEEQEFLEDDFRSAAEGLGLDVVEIKLAGGERFLEVPLGIEITQVVSKSLATIGLSCEVTKDAKVEFMNELD